MMDDMKEMGYKVTHVVLPSGGMIHAVGSREEVQNAFAKVGVLPTGLSILELGEEAALLSNGMLLLGDHPYSGPTSVPLPGKDTGFVQQAENAKVEL